VLESLAGMSLDRTRCPVLALVLTLALLALLTGACQKPSPSPAKDGLQTPNGEPRQYSATIVRSVEGGIRTEVRVARSGDLRREEWNQDGETRVSIWRPDLGRVYLLSLQQQVYVESDLSEAPAARQALGLGAAAASKGGRKTGESDQAIYTESIERALGDEAVPERVETEELPEQVVGGHRCRATRQRSSFSGGQVETTLTFRALDLEGLAIRQEWEAAGPAGRIRLVTEWREIQTSASPEEFEIPTGFKRVNSLERNGG
jgi:hypothetical protein